MMRNNSATMSSASQIVSRSLHEPVRKFLSVRGKQIRGALVRLSYSLAGGEGKVPDPISQAIEWLHAGSLVIDDVQDESAQRRGQPTMHRELGVPLAINAGNYMYFKALEIVTRSSLAADSRGRILDEMIRVARVCHEGQAIDLAARVDQLPHDQWPQISRAIATQKTGVLVELAMRLGAIAAAADHRLEDSLGRFGCQVGVALQMRNDVDEIARIAAEASAGRPLGRIDDLRHRRVTWPWAWLAEQADGATCDRLAAQLKQAVDRHDESDFGKVASELLERVQTHAQRAIEKQIEEPARLLGEYVLDPRGLKSLRDCLQLIEHGNLHVPSSPAKDLEVLS